MKILKNILIIAVSIVFCYMIYLFIAGSVENFLLKKIISRLEADSKIAEVIVTEAKFNPLTKKTETAIKFVEFNSKGIPLKPKYYNFSDNILQFQSLVIRFDTAYVKKGDFLKGKSIYLFTKVFCLDKGNTEIFDITNLNEIPDGYKTGKGFNFFEKRLWKKFWKYALNAELAKKEGIRIAQIEAPGTKFVPGLIYVIKIDHAGGIKIASEKIPDILNNR